MKLLEICNQYRDAFNQLDDIADSICVNEDGEPIDSEGNPIDPVEYMKQKEEEWMSVLEGISNDFDAKVENVSLYIEELDSNEKLLAESIKRLQGRKKAIENRKERLKNYLLYCMENMQVDKVETANVKVSLRKNAPSVLVYDEKAFVKNMKGVRDDLLKFSEPTIDKTALKTALKAGEEITGATLEVKKSIIIK